MLTYNAVFEEHGEYVGLAYEKLVDNFIKNESTVKSIEALIKVAPNAVTDYLIWRADKHAKQEIAEAAKHDILPVPKNATCPRCDADVKWDWDQDIYVVNKQSAKHVESYDALFQGTTKSLCPICNKTLAVTITDDDGETTYNHPTLESIDWELDINNWK